jgi:hypothetical protein
MTTEVYEGAIGIDLGESTRVLRVMDIGSN